jgi:hypothetical protein
MEKRGGDGYTTEYDEHRFSCPRPVKLSLIVQTTKYFQFLFWQFLIFIVIMHLHIVNSWQTRYFFMFMHIHEYSMSSNRKSNSCDLFYIVLNKNWKYLVVWTIKLSFTGLGQENRCSSYSVVYPSPPLFSILIQLYNIRPCLL